MNNLTHSVLFALNSLRKNIGRAIMTVFGIMIGIAMVIIVLSAGQGVRGLILGELSSFGNNWINIETKLPSGSTGEGVSVTTLTLDDREEIASLRNVKNTYAGLTAQGVIAKNNNTMRPLIFGVSDTYVDINVSRVEEGRFFSKEEDKRQDQVAVIGSDVKENLFGNSDAVGESITIDKNSFEVIGVMEELGNSGFINMDEMVYLPVQTVQKKMLGVDHVGWIVAEIKNNDIAKDTAEEIKYILRDRHDISSPDRDDFLVTTMDEAIGLVDTILTGVTGLLVALSAISLLVGGVGIMNVMYVSVAERTFEIGLRKSVGATKRQILLQFLIEAIVITFLGGVLGILIGSGISFLIATVASLLGFAWSFSISLFSILLGTIFSALVGIIFGLYPAKQAAELDPIVAIRQE